MISEGKVLGDQASHAWRGYPQSVIYMTKNREIKIERIRLAADILPNVVWAIGGLGIVTPYGYSPNSEGFSGTYSDVLRTTNKTFMGYKKDEDLIYLCIRPYSSHDRIIESVKNLKLDFAISLDGGGSSSLKINDKVLIPGDGRKVNNYIGIK